MSIASHNSHELQNWKRRIQKWNLGATITLTILTGLWTLPTLGLFITSLRPDFVAQVSPWWEAVFNPLGQEWTIDAYQETLDGGMGDALINTFAVAIPSTILPLMIAANAAFAFAFLNFRGKEFWFAILIGLMVIPLQSSLIPVLKGMVWLLRNYEIRLTGTFVSAWIVHSAFGMPLAIYTFRNYMMTLPRSLIESAKVDGASEYQIFWRVVLPLSIPVIASFGIFQFLWVWNDYLIAFIFVGEQKPVLTYNLLKLLGQYGEGWRDVAAGSFISMIIPLMVFFGLQRYFVRGLMAGSVKG